MHLLARGILPRRHCSMLVRRTSRADGWAGRHAGRCAGIHCWPQSHYWPCRRQSDKCALCHASLGPCSGIFLCHFFYCPRKRDTRPRGRRLARSVGFAHMHRCPLIHARTRARAHARAHARTHVRTRTHTRTHTHTVPSHTHSHARACVRASIANADLSFAVKDNDTCKDARWQEKGTPERKSACAKGAHQGLTLV